MDMVDFRDVVDLFCSYDSGIQMSNASCNQHHKGPASPLDDMLKTRFKQAGKSNSKKRLHHPGPHHHRRPLAKQVVNINSEQNTTSLDDLLDNLNLCERNKNETRGPTLPHEYGFKTCFLQPGKSRSKKTASGMTSSSAFGKAGVNIEIVHATTSVKDTLNNLNLSEKNQIETVNENGAPDVRAQLGLPGVRINLRWRP